MAKKSKKTQKKNPRATSERGFAKMNMAVGYDEYAGYQKAATEKGLTLAAWARTVLRRAAGL
jgi:hypothetical protein